MLIMLTSWAALVSNSLFGWSLQRLYLILLESRVSHTDSGMGGTQFKKLANFALFVKVMYSKKMCAKRPKKNLYPPTILGNPDLHAIKVPAKFEINIKHLGFFQNVRISLEKGHLFQLTA